MSSRTEQYPTRPAPKNPSSTAVRATLPIRPHTDTEFITEQQMAAAYAARLAELPLIPITAWTDPQPNGGIRAYFPGGASLTHTPNGFTAITPCPNGACHIDRITNGAQLHEAAQAAAHCTNFHGRPRTLTRNDIDTGLANRAADTGQAKEHPAP
ncbi:hypothetical protein [Streptomyces atratus]|uniref:hypothetical protein n=1 Tax=Streptomyces atratus TaxID=1893 RepID=UPI002F91ADA4